MRQTLSSAVDHIRHRFIGSKSIDERRGIKTSVWIAVAVGVTVWVSWIPVTLLAVLLYGGPLDHAVRHGYVNWRAVTKWTMIAVGASAVALGVAFDPWTGIAMAVFGVAEAIVVVSFAVALVTGLSLWDHRSGRSQRKALLGSLAVIGVTMTVMIALSRVVENVPSSLTGVSFLLVVIPTMAWVLHCDQLN